MKTVQEINNKTQELIQKFAELGITPPEHSAACIDTVASQLDDFFAIEKPESPVQLRSETDCRLYQEQLLDVYRLKDFADRYPDRQDGYDGYYTRAVRKIADYICDKIQQDMDKMGSKPVTDQIDRLIDRTKTILKKISALTGAMCDSVTLDRTTHVLHELSDVLREYLQRLGVYSVVAHPGDNYELYSSDYDPVVRPEGRSTSSVGRLMRPALKIDFQTEDGEDQQVYRPGRCYVE